MVKVGYLNRLKIVKSTDYGMFLDAGVKEDGETLTILMPQRYVDKSMNVGDEVDVFVGLDSEDRMFASPELPYVMVGEVDKLEVVDTNATGAFLDWGMPKDLFLPFIEQTYPVQKGDEVIVAVYLDNSGRIAASMRLQRHLSQKKAELVANTEVNALVVTQNDVGYRVVVNDTHWGILYSSEVFQKLKIGEHIKAYVKKCRPDGKIDLYLKPLGYSAVPGIEGQILKMLEEDGFFAYTEKTSPEEIHRLFGVSKKKFKMALGGLYKKRQISIDEKGIRLVSTPSR